MRGSAVAALSAVAAMVTLAGVAVGVSLAADNAVDASGLRNAASFAATEDKTARAIAMFQEAGKVIQHPRCVNCHPAGDSPLQGMTMHKHQPPVSRGEGDIGMPGMMCNTCHGPANAEIVDQAETLKSIPGNPAWHLAPIEMAWEGKSLGYICEQIKDPARNGGKTMDELVEHMAHDSLVGWGWNPGAGREPVPGSQEVFGELIRRWAADGAACPPA
jgi:hypothetical protein